MRGWSVVQFGGRGFVFSLNSGFGGGEGGGTHVTSQYWGLKTSWVIAGRTTRAGSLLQEHPTAFCSSSCSFLTSAFLVLARHEK